MDARIGKQHQHEQDPEPAAEEARSLAETITVKRDRLLASLTLIAGFGLLNVADATWAHGIGVACLIGFVVFASAQSSFPRPRKTRFPDSPSPPL